MPRRSLTPLRENTEQPAGVVGHASRLNRNRLLLLAAAVAAAAIVVVVLIVVGAGKDSTKTVTGADSTSAHAHPFKGVPQRGGDARQRGRAGHTHCLR